CVVFCPSFISYFDLSSHPPPTEILTLSLHDALPISNNERFLNKFLLQAAYLFPVQSEKDYVFHLLHIRACLRIIHRPIWQVLSSDRKSTRLNSSHVSISYAVFCLKKKTQ